MTKSFLIWIKCKMKADKKSKQDFSCFYFREKIRLGNTFLATCIVRFCHKTDPTYRRVNAKFPIYQPEKGVRLIGGSTYRRVYTVWQLGFLKKMAARKYNFIAPLCSAHQKLHIPIWITSNSSYYTFWYIKCRSGKIRDKKALKGQ